MISPLTHPQKRIWLSEQQHLSGSYDNLVGYLWYEKALDPHQAIKAIETLYTSYPILGANVTGILEPMMEKAFFEAEIHTISLETENELEAVLSAINRQPFEIGEEALMQFSLIVLKDQVRGVHFRGHHILLDAMSIGLLVRAFEQAYKDQVLDSDLGDYQRFIDQEKAYLNGPNYRSDQGFWDSRIKDLEAYEPMIWNQQPKTLYDTKRMTYTIQPALHDQIKAYLGSHKTSLYRFMTTIIYIYLYRMTGKKDLVLMAGHHNRSESSQSVVGMTVSTVPLIQTIDGQMSFEAFRQAVHQTLKESFSHQAFPFDHMAKLMRDKGIDPESLFQVSLNQIPKAPDLDGTLVRMSTEMDYLMMNIKINPNQKSVEEVLDLGVDYATACYDDQAMSYFFKRIEKIIQAVVLNPMILIDEVPLGLEEEVGYLHTLAHGNRPKQKVYKSIPYQMNAMIQLYGDCIALKGPEGSYTYEALGQRISYYDQVLEAVEPKEIVGIYSHRTMDIVPMVLSIMKKKAVFMPMDRSLSKEVRDTYLEAAGAAWLIEDTSGGLVLESAMTNRPCHIDAAYVLTTSGTDGHPKVVVIGRDSYAHFCAHYIRDFGLNSETKAMAYCSYGFDVSLSEYIPPLLVGGQVYMTDDLTRKSIQGLMKCIEDQEINTVTLPTALGRLFMEEQAPQSLSRLIVAGEALGSYRQQAYEVINAYGPTEATIYSTYYPLHRSMEDAPIGRGLGNTETYVLNEDRTLTPYGQVGQLYLGGSQVAKGYLNSPSQGFHHELDLVEGGEFHHVTGLYATGDLVWWHEGQLRYLGRVDNQIKHHGYRIELGAINAWINQMEGVLESYTLYEGGQLVVIYSSKTVIEKGAFEAYLSRHLPAYMVPKVYQWVQDIPKNHSGKLAPESITIDKQNKRFRGTKTQEIMKGLWQKHLKIRDMALEDDFFTLGGDSLSLMGLLLDIEKTFGQAIPYGAAYKQRTLEAFAEAVTLESHPDYFYEMNTATSTRHIFCFFDYSGESYAYGHLADYYDHQCHVYGSRFIEDFADYDTISQVAGLYLEDIRKVRGEVVLMGYSFGGLMATEVYRLMTSRERQAVKLCIVDCPNIERFNGKAFLIFAIKNGGRWLRRMNRHYQVAFLKSQLDHLTLKKGSLQSFMLAQRTINHWLAKRKRRKVRGRAYLFMGSHRKKRGDYLGWRGHFTQIKGSILRGNHTQLLQGDNLQGIDKRVFGGNKQ